jgi:hypothetical protein
MNHAISILALSLLLGFSIAADAGVRTLPSAFHFAESDLQ